MKTITSVLVLLLFVGVASADTISLVQSVRLEAGFEIYDFEFVSDNPTAEVTGMSGKFTGQFNQVISLPFVTETPNMQWGGSLDLTYDTHFGHVDADVSPIGDEYENATELGSAPDGDPISSALVLNPGFGNLSGQLVQLAGAPVPHVYANLSTGAGITLIDTPFDPIPEPATMGVLALGSLGMLIRRRRR